MQEDLIYDIGMHSGEDTAFYLAKGFRVVAVEANPLLVEKNRERFREEIDQGRLTIVGKGVAAKSGVLPFYVNDTYSEWSSFVEDLGCREGRFHVIEVEAGPLDDALAELGVPYYMKVDIEGHDDLALEALSRSATIPRHVSVENGLRPQFDALCELGYTRFKWINQAKVAEVRCPTPAREGREIDFTFVFGSSGPFGEEAPGPWLTGDEAWALIDAYWSNPDRDANIHGWFDLHGALPATPG